MESNRVHCGHTVINRGVLVLYTMNAQYKVLC